MAKRRNVNTKGNKNNTKNGNGLKIKSIFNLTKSDEHNVLFFYSGFTFGIALIVLLFNEIQAFIAALSVLVVLWYLNSRMGKQ